LAYGDGIARDPGAETSVDVRTLPPMMRPLLDSATPHSPEEGNGTPMYINKAEIVATLRSRGLHERANWVDRELAELVDTDRNSSLLETLDISPLDMSPVEVAPL
jgi:hypothetical protein